MGGAPERRERLLEAIGGIERISALPDGRIDTVAEVKAAIQAANELAELSELEDALDAVEAASEDFSPLASAVVALVKIRADDRLVIGHGASDLSLLRVDFQGMEAAIPEIEATLQPTTDDSMWLRSARQGEEEELAFAGEFQFIVEGTEEATAGLEDLLEELSTTREREVHGLLGELGVLYGLGVGLRAMWGSGLATLTDQRMLGVVFDHRIQGRPSSNEEAWMPGAFVANDLSSVLVFDLPRSSISEAEIIDKGFFARRIPYANLNGDNFSLSCQTLRILDAGRLVKPGKDVLASALRALA